MRYPTYGSVAFGLFVILLATPGAQQAPATARSAVDVSKLGPQVGERIPAFALTDQTGKSWTNETIMGPKGALLVFFRSADW